MPENTIEWRIEIGDENFLKVNKHAVYLIKWIVLYLIIGESYRLDLVHAVYQQ